MSMEQVLDTLTTGKQYYDTVFGGTILYKDGVAISISDDNVIRTVIGNAKVKSTWKEKK